MKINVRGRPYSPEQIERQFRAPRGTRKIECVSCGERGYPGGSWMDKHMEGHRPCPECGKVRPVFTMGYHRAYHRRAQR